MGRRGSEPTLWVARRRRLTSGALADPPCRRRSDLLHLHGLPPFLAVGAWERPNGEAVSRILMDTLPLPLRSGVLADKRYWRRLDGLDLHGSPPFLTLGYLVRPANAEDR